MMRSNIGIVNAGNGFSGNGRQSEYELPREIHCLAVRRDSDDAKYSLAAVGVKNVVKIIKANVDPDSHHVKVSEYTTATISRDGVITDVAWNPNQNTSFLVCHSKGIIKYFNIETNQAQNLGLASPWSYQHDDNYIASLSWNAKDRKLFCAAIRGAPARLYDTSKPGSIAILSGKSTRDIAFHPTLDELLLVGDVDNVVKVFDRRKLSEHVFRVEPFDKSSSITHVDWFASHDPMSFIASSANMVKIYQCNNCPINSEHNNNNNTTNNIGNVDYFSPSSSQQQLPAPIHTSNATLRTAMIQSNVGTAQEIHRIFVSGVLKNVSTDNGVITTLSSQGQDSDASSLLSTFDLRSSYTPQSVLRGAQVTCFDWLAQNHQQFLLWGGADGRLSIRHPHTGYHPREDINDLVSAISSRGHLALHNPSNKGNLTFGLALFEDLDAAKQKKHGAEGTVSDPALLQLLAKSYRLPWNLAPIPRNKDTTNNNNNNDNINTVNGNNQNNVNNDATTMKSNDSNNSLIISTCFSTEENLTDGLSLHTSNRKSGLSHENLTISTTHTNVTNAAHNTHNNIHLGRRHKKALRFYREIIRACQFNMAVANKAGLRSRAAVWSALIALLPRPEDTLAMFLQYSKHNSNNTITNIDAVSYLSTSASYHIQQTPSNNSNNNDITVIPDADMLLQDILRELLDCGDSLHYVIVREIIVRCIRAQAYQGLTSEDQDQTLFQTLNKTLAVTHRRVTHIYMAYIELLRRFTLPELANDIMKYAIDPMIMQRARADVTFKLSCALCSGSELRNRSINLRKTTSYCMKCKVCVSYCSVCCQPVTGLVQWCVVCGHGGHFKCLQKWFRTVPMLMVPQNVCSVITPSLNMAATTTVNSNIILNNNMNNTTHNGTFSLAPGSNPASNHVFYNTGHILTPNNIINVPTHHNQNNVNVVHSNTAMSGGNNMTMNYTASSSNNINNAGTTNINNISTGNINSTTNTAANSNFYMYTNSNSKTCPSGCGHKCAYSKPSYSPNMMDDLKRFSCPLPQQIPLAQQQSLQYKYTPNNNNMNSNNNVNNSNIAKMGSTNANSNMVHSGSSSNLAGMNLTAVTLNSASSNNNYNIMNNTNSIHGTTATALAVNSSIANSTLNNNTSGTNSISVTSSSAVEAPVSASSATMPHNMNYRAITTLSAAEIRRSQLYRYLRNAPVAATASNTTSNTANAAVVASANTSLITPPLVASVTANTSANTTSDLEGGDNMYGMTLGAALGF